MSSVQSSEAPHSGESSPAAAPWRLGQLYEATDHYALVLVLILVDYLAISVQGQSAWGRVVVTVFTGATLLLTLRVAHARRMWIALAAIYLVGSTLLVAAAAAVSANGMFKRDVASIGGLLLIIAPFVILGDIARHPVVDTDTVLGAICVYLLFGISFAVIYGATDALSAQPFFVGVPHATSNNYLFFSFMTLTTVGYGNLIPASGFGQTCAMLEALSGQIYLVLVVARLVSLWGQQNPRAARRSPSGEDALDPVSQPEA